MSFRLGGTDGVSVEAAKWAHALAELGWRVATVAGEGPVDHLVPGLAIGAVAPPTANELAAALQDADLVVVENLLSLPLNPLAADMIARTLQGRLAVLHHHDLAWQRPLLGNVGAPPEHRYWRHVTVNDLSRGELAARGIEATTIRNHFDPRPIPGDRRATRFDAGIPSHATVVLQPTRAIARKRVAAGLALAEALGATYWLTERAEEGWERELARVLAGATVPVVHRALRSVADAYAAADLVVLPSSWEGFGNPAVEAGLHGRPVAVGPYPVATELQGLGFDWYDADDPGTVRLPGHDLAAANAEVARRHLNLNDLPARLAAVLDGLAW